MPVRPSQVLARRRAGQAAHGVAIRFTDPTVAEFAAQLGFDALWLDLEHQRLSVETAAELIRAARAGGAADIVARPGKGEFARMARLLEAGARGLMYPRCESAAEAAEVVRWAKFPPLGERGLDGISPDNPFGLTPAAEYVTQANAETFVIAQIESPAALDQAEAIAAVPGIDFLMLGPADFSCSLGLAGQVRHAQVAAAQQRLREAATAAGKGWVATCFDREHAQQCQREGAALLFHGSDWRLLSTGLRQLAAEIQTP